MKEQVWMHKKTGQLYEYFESWIGGVLAVVVRLAA